MDKISISQAVTLAIAVVGAVLGIINTYRSLVKDRLRVIVRPTNMFILNHKAFGGGISEKGVSVEVINLSTIAVSIIEIGFANFYLFRNKIKGGKHLPNDVGNTQNKTMPLRLESRESTTFYILDSALKNMKDAESIKYLYARTACGHFIKGTSSLFREAIKDAQK